MLTFDGIMQALADMDAPRGGIVTVHSAMKQIGPIDGGAETLLDALIAYFTQEGGLLFIPTHTWCKLTPTLDLLEPKSGIGVLANVAARDKRAIRSLHPTQSLAVFGDRQRALDFVSGEEKMVTMTSPKGCYGKFYEQGGHILLLGVGQDKNTFLHCVEEMLGVENRIAKEPMDCTIRHLDGSLEHRSLYVIQSEGIEDVSHQYTKYEPAFRKHGCIRDGVLGNAKVQLCDARRIKAVMELIYQRSGGVELLADHTPIPEEFY